MIGTDVAEDGSPIAASLKEGRRVRLSRVTSLLISGGVESQSTGSELHAFSIEDLQLLLALPRRKIKTLITKGELDPNDLESICWQWYNRSQSADFVRQWPFDPSDRIAAAARVSERRRLSRGRRRKATYTAPSGTVRTIELPDPNDI